MASPKQRAKKKGEHVHSRSAADIKELRERLTEFSPEELNRIPIVPTGIALQQGAVYLDLQNRAFGPFVAPGGSTAEEPHLYVPQAEVREEYWNRLLPRQNRMTEPPQGLSEKGKPPESTIDKTLADSFPTSDPPSWTTGREKE